MRGRVQLRKTSTITNKILAFCLVKKILAFPRNPWASTQKVHGLAPRKSLGFYRKNRSTSNPKIPELLSPKLLHFYPKNCGLPRSHNILGFGDIKTRDRATQWYVLDTHRPTIEKRPADKRYDALMRYIVLTPWAGSKQRGKIRVRQISFPQRQTHQILQTRHQHVITHTYPQIKSLLFTCSENRCFELLTKHTPVPHQT